MSEGNDDSSPIDFTPALCFNPPNKKDTPETLFSLSDKNSLRAGARFIRNSDQHQVLVYTAGACPNDGPNAGIGGCALVFKSGNSPDAIKDGITSFRLEDRGPSQVAHKPTSDRAELRAAIAALQFRAWEGEGHNKLVIATDSEYVVSGATEDVKGWVKRGWRTSQGKEVKDRDLWELLFADIQSLKDSNWRSLSVMFWLISREWNTVACQAALKAAVATAERNHSFTTINGTLV